MYEKIAIDCLDFTDRAVPPVSLSFQQSATTTKARVHKRFRLPAEVLTLVTRVENLAED